MRSHSDRLRAAAPLAIPPVIAGQQHEIQKPRARVRHEDGRCAERHELPDREQPWMVRSARKLQLVTPRVRCGALETQGRQPEEERKRARDGQRRQRSMMSTEKAFGIDNAWGKGLRCTDVNSHDRTS